MLFQNAYVKLDEVIKGSFKMKQSHIYRNIAVFSTMLLAAFSAVYFYSPVIITHAAVDESSASTKVNVNVNASISLSTSTEELSMNANINSFVHDSMNLTVITNSQYGYTLSIEDADANTNMVHEDSSITDVVTSNFTGAKTSSTMDNNTWGWSTDSGANYYRIPEFGLSTLIARADGVIPGGTATAAVDFGVNVGLLTSGTYSDTVIFTAYTNGPGGLTEKGTGIAAKGAKVDGIMQNFNCSTLASGNTVTLKDSRDNNTYTVTKIADDKCWMTENLRITNATLTSEDSDLEKTITLGKAVGEDAMLRMTSQMAYGEEFVLKVLSRLIAEKTGLPLEQVSAMTAEQQMALLTPEQTTEIVSELQTSMYEYEDSLSSSIIYGDLAYGGYYQTTTALGGFSNASDAISAKSDATVTTSICPKGWKLPTETEFTTMAGKYSNKASTLLAAPINFKLGGDIAFNYDDGENVSAPSSISFESVGEIAHYMTASVKYVSSGNSGYTQPRVFHIDSNKVQIEGGSSSVFVRCIAR